MADSPAANADWPDRTAESAVLVIRHGETEWSRTGKHTGRTDVPLTDLGEQQAATAGRLIRAVLGDRTPSLIISSPRVRARRTAELAGFTPQLISDDAAEWDYGDYEGMTSPEIEQVHPGWSIWHGPWPGGESADQVSARFDRLIAGAATELRQRQASGPVLVFSHGHAIRCIGARWLDIDVTTGSRFRLGTGAVSALGFEHTDPVISHWNIDSTLADVAG